MAINTAFRSKASLFQPLDDSDRGEIEQDTTPLAPVAAPQSGLVDIYNSISKDMQPGPAQMNYRKYLDSEPTRDQYQPTRRDKIGGILSGVGAALQGDPDASKIKDARLNRSFNNATTDWNSKGNRLAKGAELEEKDINNRVKTYRDFLADKDKTDAERETARFHDMQNAHWGNQDKAATKRMTLQGWNFSTRATDGHRVATRINPDSPAGVDTMDLGKFGETPQEKDVRDNKNFGIRSGITGNRMKDIFNFERQPRLEDQKEMVDYREGYKLDAAERKKMEAAVKDKSSPQRDMAIKALALRDVLDENPQLSKKGWFGSDAKINLRTLDYDGTDPEVSRLVKAAINKWSTKYEPKVPAGKAPKTGNTSPAVLKDKNGKEWNVAPENIEAFKKANGIQ